MERHGETSSVDCQAKRSPNASLGRQQCHSVNSCRKESNPSACSIGCPVSTRQRTAVRSCSQDTSEATTCCGSRPDRKKRTSCCRHHCLNRGYRCCIVAWPNRGMPSISKTAFSARSTSIRDRMSIGGCYEHPWFGRAKR